MFNVARAIHAFNVSRVLMGALKITSASPESYGSARIEITIRELILLVVKSAVRP